ncbi:flagellar hook-associated protein 2 [Bacillus mangrovi]|uniref:Flagellar hook-associated protein 2 n=1 Tax=Metabacillus mangrovi TaxID=1491830 RepID=A0A7X2S5M6_9BACI|nr:flagellar hook-associated protein 2 [Metabacillus mangrovi]MTH53708.1 flagellar hook-associated protein 2 [Metabacillus mangrovi]
MVRIGGLASGMDIDTMVSDLMKAERMGVDKLKQKKQILEWQRDNYRDMNKLLKELDDMLSPITKNSLTLQSTFNKKAVSSSNDAAVSAKAISASANFSSSIEVTELASSASWKGALNPSLPAGAKEMVFKVTDPGSSTPRDVKISIAAGDTMEQVLSKINSSSLGVSAMQATLKGESQARIILTSSKTGASGAIVADNDDAKAFMTTLGFSFNADNQTLKKDQTGTDAIVKVNGYEMVQPSNTFTINGVEYNAKQKTNGIPVNISSSTDVDSIVESVVKFVDKYNEIIGKVNGEISEDRYRSYQPLTDAERESLSDKQIEQWEEKAKSGLLKNDSVLASGLNKMRTDFYSPVSGTGTIAGYTQLADIGIKTTSNYMEKGKLIIDEAKLREKIQANPAAVYELFNSKGTTPETTGLAGRLRDTIKDTITKVESKAGNSLMTTQKFSIGKSLDSLDTQIDRFEDRLVQIEDRYWRQFTAMEKAIQRANEQSAQLMNFNGGY